MLSIPAGEWKMPGYQWGSMRAFFFVFIVVVTLGLSCRVSKADGLATPAPKADAPKPQPPKPTLSNVAYGPHARQVLDFYQASSARPAPLLFFIHGGGWLNGDKAIFNSAGSYLAAGISVVSINYRLIADAEAEGIVPPVKAPLLDAARALQFVRSKAAEWHLDKERIGASGSSAGACSALWLAFHPEMADPASADPVARESTRLQCAAVVHPQTTLDPQQMIEWIPNINYGGHAFGFKGDPGKELTPFAEFLSQREKILPWIAEYSPYPHASPDDPPIYLIYETPPAMGQPQASTAHSANFGVGLAARLKSLGIVYELNYPGAPAVKHRDVRQFLLDFFQSSETGK